MALRSLGKERDAYYARQISRGRSLEAVNADREAEAAGALYNVTNKGGQGRAYAGTADETVRRMLAGEEGSGRGHRTYGGTGFTGGGIDGTRQVFQQRIEDARGQGAYGRGLQRDALGMMLGIAQGTGPSVAGAMHTQGMRDATGNALALTRASRGNQALGMRNALAQQGALSASANLGAAQMRAKEMADARAALFGSASGYSGMSLQEQLAYENLLSQAEIASLNAAMGNREMELKERAQNMELGAAVAKGAADAGAAAATGGASSAGGR